MDPKASIYVTRVPGPCMHHYNVQLPFQTTVHLPQRWEHPELATGRQGWSIVAVGIAPEYPECCWSTAARTR